MDGFTQWLIGVTFLLIAQVVVAQQSYDIILQTVTIRDIDRQAEVPITKRNLFQYQYEQEYYLILQFDSVPDARLRAQLQERGIKLLGYLPNLAYWASIPGEIDINTLPVRRIILPKPDYKLALPLYDHSYQPIYSGSTLLLQAFPFPNISTEHLSMELAQKGYAIENIDTKHIQLSVKPDQLMPLASLPAIMYLETAPPEPSPEDMVARSLHGIHILSNSSGLGLDGTGVIISTADDGIAVHPDLKNRVTTYLDTDDSRHHSDMVLGILTGAGNIDQTAIGMAPGATVHLYDIFTYDHIDLAVDNFKSYAATITSTAYAEGCGGYYGGSARKIDDQVYKNPFLMHCFSAGNEANESCSNVYGQLLDDYNYSFGNITGGQKAAKNVITVGNLHYDDRLMILSSRGPANDGRIKPDLCAYGQGQQSIYPDHSYRASGGSSAAVPVVAGAAALLTQLYKEQQQDDTITMPSDLLKPIMLNTTEDLGASGPDFKYGWGRLQIQRAAEILLNKQYIRAGVTHQQEMIHSINIPADALDLRVMLYWHDPAANLSAGKALVNDLDLIVEPANSASIRPWVLSAVAHMDSINKPAYRGIDRINNVEQVGIDFPQEGSYQIRVKGQLVPEGPQLYYLVYSYRRKALNITYPAGGESFSPGENQVIRWDAFGLDTPFNLEYRFAGQPWNTIATNLSPQLRHFNWHVPDHITGLAQIRIRSGNQQDIPPKYFSILGQPKFDFLYQNEQSTWMQWTPVEGADSYDVFMLGERYMQHIGSTSEHNFRIQADPEKINWYSVRARNSDGTIGRRAVAKRFLNLSCEINVYLKFQFDAFPNEIQWQLRNQEGVIIAKGGPYNEYDPISQLEFSTCIPYGCYELTVMDSYGDGLCCVGHQGYYELTDENGLVLASGAAFEHEDRTNFCLDPITNPTPPKPITVTIVNYRGVSCAGGSDGMVEVLATGGQGDFTYQWNNGQSGPILRNVNVGSYQITVTNSLSTITEQIQMNEPVPLTLAFDMIPDACHEGSPSQISANISGGTPPYDYSWNNGSNEPAITDVEAGQYTLSVTDANGCQVIRSATLKPPVNMNLSLFVQHPTCSESNDGRVLTALFGGQAPFEFLWSTGDSSIFIDQLSSGFYSLTVTDANGCQVIRSATLKPPVNMNLSLFIQHSTCSESNDGRVLTALFGGQAPFEFLWSTGDSSIFIDQLSSGFYSLTVTDANGCQVSAQATLLSPPPINIEATITPVSTLSQGGILLKVDGSTPDYRYKWSDGQTSANLTELPAGEYSVTITDDRSCSQSRTFTVPDESTVPPLTYCVASGNHLAQEWIELVGINNVLFPSGNNRGYKSHLEHPVHVATGLPFTLKLVRGRETISNLHYWRVWIDFNQNGSFDDPGELLFQNDLFQDTFNVQIPIPANLTGQTRMRVAMKWGSYPISCGNLKWGEVEDFTLLFAQPKLGAREQSPHLSLPKPGNHSNPFFQIFPNPARDHLWLKYGRLPSEPGTLFLTNGQGKRIKQWEWNNEGASGIRQISLPSTLNPGIYQLYLQIGQWYEINRLVVQ